ncbi:probable transport accessory protein MmpS3 [Palaemon carinicauda]|uniref:probable transport accessory protein MmpS3 n=1 Tax=Palaemon carinicauda TaxID=392227 RepID=UPI0035B6A57B
MDLVTQAVTGKINAEAIATSIEQVLMDFVSRPKSSQPPSHAIQEITSHTSTTTPTIPSPQPPVPSTSATPDPTPIIPSTIPSSTHTPSTSSSEVKAIAFAPRDPRQYSSTYIQE